MLKLLWIETVLKLAAGAALLLFPVATARVLGLPRAEVSFWPLLLGGVLAGVAAAAFLEGFVKNSHGLGLAGAMAINLAGAATIATLLVAGNDVTTRRGRLALWLAAIVLAGLAFVELANV